MIITDNKGWVKIIRDEEIKKEIGNSRKSWHVDYYLYNGIWENSWKQYGQMIISEYRF